MLKIRIIVVDRTRAGFLREGESFYLKRLRYYATVEWAVVKPVKIVKGKNDRGILNAEGEAVERKLFPKEYVVALDRTGDPMDSEGIADWLDNLARQASGGVSFVIGGPLGLSKNILKRAQKVFSLSRLTLTHEMSRLVLLEQLYRAMTILSGEKYHK
ncbi:MAG: 23S rRNA (pseudouridine(1915)-N(3))-methyltransferase RlmH [Deltaproteobacteria bacterium]|nr:23S rRNA (pseudouridine(1915)-N(3))-methyltransferase RlmH [Deltaproteobacteria bacterium]